LRILTLMSDRELIVYVGCYTTADRKGHGEGISAYRMDPDSGEWQSIGLLAKVAKDFGRSEKEDIQRLAAVRKAVGDDVEIYVDANNGYYAKQAIGMARHLSEYDVKWFEEPVLADDVSGLAAIARAIDIPVATGEHEYTRYGFKSLIAEGGADIVQPDVGRVGGVSEWMKVAHLAQAFNLPIAPHAVQLVHLHLACCIPNLKVVEYLGTVEEGDRIWYTEFPQPRDGYWSPYLEGRTTWTMQLLADYQYCVRLLFAEGALKGRHVQAGCCTRCCTRAVLRCF
jgi:L-alanine-DL-glutamate epimerase-like enolase superfamily enzyme